MFSRSNDSGREARKGAAEELSQLTAATLAAEAAEHLGECELITVCLLEWKRSNPLLTGLSYELSSCNTEEGEYGTVE